MSQPLARRCVRRGVYTILWLPGLVLAAVLITVPAPAQIEVTSTPAMTKGPARAAVTIVEFSDYQ